MWQRYKANYRRKTLGSTASKIRQTKKVEFGCLTLFIIDRFSQQLRYEGW